MTTVLISVDNTLKMIYINDPRQITFNQEIGKKNISRNINHLLNLIANQKEFSIRGFYGKIFNNSIISR